MNIKIELITSHPIAYIRRIGAYGAGNIQTMERLKRWAASNNLMDENTVILGIAYDDAANTAPENCRYDACIVLDNTNIKDTSTVQLSEISGGRYAVFTIEHTAEAMGRAWADVFPTLSVSGHIVDFTRPILERYSAGNVSQHLCEICVAIC